MSPLLLDVSRSALALCALCALSAASTRYVNGSLATGNNDGSSWADAHRGLDAVAVALAAAQPGDEIWVASGTYFPTLTTTRTISHMLENDVAVYGGFAGDETLLAQRDVAAHVTTLSGDIGASGVDTDNSEHVVHGAGTNASAILDGFTIERGYSQGNVSGAGILCIEGASPRIRNCRFLANHAGLTGGGAYVEAAAPTFTDCRFESNFAFAGGGAFCRTTSVTFDRCEFVGNIANNAGGLYLLNHVAPPAGPSRVVNSSFTGNTGVVTSALTLSTEAADEIQIVNCTIVGNTSLDVPRVGVQVYGGSTLANCIVWGNGPPMYPPGNVIQIAGPATVRYSIVQGGFAGVGNLDSNPGFASGGFHLVTGSPAIDAGDNGAVPAGSILDLARQPRFQDEPTVPDTGLGSPPVVDLGAYEGGTPQVQAFCFGDGSGTPCPCGNDAPLSGGTGCLNATGSGGLLSTSGVASTEYDTLVLRGSQMTESTCLYFQGTGQAGAGQGVVFGDGLRCVAGTLVRLWTVTNVGGASQVPPPGEPSVHIRGQVPWWGGVRHYQVWYRDVSSYCSADTWNLTNAVTVSWEN